MIRKCSPKLAIVAVSLAMLDIRAGQAASQTLEKIKELGKVTFGHREASIPFAYLGVDQKPTGLSLIYVPRSPTNSGPNCTGRGWRSNTSR